MRLATNGPGNAAGKEDIRESSVLTKVVSPTVVIPRDEDKVSGVFRRLSNETHVQVKARKRRKGSEIVTRFTPGEEMLKHTMLGDG